MIMFDFKKGDIIVYDDFIRKSSRFVIYDSSFSFNHEYINYFINEIRSTNSSMISQKLYVNNQFSSPKSRFLDYLNLIEQIDNI